MHGDEPAVTVVASREISDHYEIEDGSHSEFVKLYARYGRRVYAFVYSLVPIESDAEDLFQQVSLVLWKKFDHFDRSRGFLSWANGVAYNVVRNYRKKRSRDKLLFSDELLEKIAHQRNGRRSADSERAEALAECLSHLTVSDATLLKQFYGEGLTATEVAHESQRTPHSIYRRISKIRSRLVKCVQGKLAVAPEIGGSQ